MSINAQYDVKDPLEYVSKEYLPWMKGLISVDLRSRGYSESKISMLIGVTQPSVNYYLRRERQAYLRRLEAIGLTNDAISEQERRLIDALQNPTTEGTTRLLLTLLDVLSSGMLCTHHKKVDNLPQDCDACMRLFGTGSAAARSSILVELNEAIDRLEQSENFPKLIPEVYTNFVAAAKDARTEKDIAGIAGRIVKLRGRAKAMNRAEFGASRHLASVLLKIKSKFPYILSIMNVCYNEGVDRSLSKLGWRIVRASMDNSRNIEADPVVSAIQEAISKLPSEPDAIIHTGGYGLEPATYILGRSPSEVCEKALQLADTYIRY
ncbi:MAG: thiamine-phosphate synthase family protein [Conexivisphaerales archaeon]